MKKKMMTGHVQDSSQDGAGDMWGYWGDTYMRASQEHCTRDSSVAVTDVTDQTEKKNWCVLRTTTA